MSAGAVRLRGSSKPGLVRGMVSPFAIWQFQVGAASPLTVVVGGLVTTYATTRVVGVPLSFPIIGICLGLLSVGYLAVAYRQKHAGAAYAALAVGLSPATGVAGGFLALAAYVGLQVALYGLLGVNMAAIIGFGTWQAWSWAALFGVALVGMLRYTLGQYAVAGITMIELVLIAMMAIAAFTHPHGGHISVTPLTLHALWPEQALPGGVFALTMASFIGFETGPPYSEEIKNERSVISATVATVLFLTVFFTLVAWSMAVWTGPDQIVGAATDQLPFNILRQYWGPAGSIAELFLISSVYISALSFHNTANRYVYALARERVLFFSLARVGLSEGHLGGTPWLASLVQSGVVAVLLAVFQLAGADPIGQMFVWLSSGAAFGLLVLLVGVSIAAVMFFRSGVGGKENVWVRTILPIIGAATGGVLAAVIAFNQSTLLNIAPNSAWQWLIPVCVGLIIASGLLYGLLIKFSTPERYAEIGRGQPDPRTEPDYQLGDIRA